MFRDLVRKNKRMPLEECIEVLKNETRSVISVLGDDEYPYGSPMNHFYNEEDGCIYFHSAVVGHRVDALKKHNKASLCVFDHGYRNEGEWALNVKSVIVFGKVEMITDHDTVVDITTKLSYKFTDDDEYIKKEIADAADHTLILKLIPEHISGKYINES